MKKVLVFSCTVQGLKKLSPIVKKLASVDGILLKLVVCGRLEVEYSKAEGIAYHRVDEYSSLTRMADWDTPTLPLMHCSIFRTRKRRICCSRLTAADSWNQCFTIAKKGIS